jgi:hypothetical protein
VYLSALRRRRCNNEGFPWNVPVVAALDALEFHIPVTFFVGENGSDKSTVLKELPPACAPSRLAAPTLSTTIHYGQHDGSPRDSPSSVGVTRARRCSFAQKTCSMTPFRYAMNAIRFGSR